MEKTNARKIEALCAMLLVVAVAAQYWRTYGFAYLRLDDFGYTAGCPFVPTGLSLENIGEAFRRITYGGIWMPVTFITYMADVTLFGGGWGVHHAVNAALHATNAAVFFVLLCRWIRGDAVRISGIFAAFAAALFWAVHPQRAEAVAWIASRKEELWTLFTLLGLAAWRNGKIFCGLACCILACLSKPTAVCFPVLALLVALDGGERFSLRMAARHLPLFAVAGVTGLVAIASQTHPEGMAAIRVLHTPFSMRLLNAAAALALGLFRMAVPVEIHFDYGDPPLVVKCGAAAALAVAVLAALAIWRKRLLAGKCAFLAAFFAASWLPVSGLAGSFGESPVADRFLYMPAMAVSAALALFLRKRGHAALAGFCALALAFAAAAFPAIASYRNDFTAFSRTLEHEPDNWRALCHVGSEYCARLGKMDEGIEMMRRSYRISPRDSTGEVLAYSLACRANPGDDAEILRLGAKFLGNPRLDRRGMFNEAIGAALLMERRHAHAIAFLSASLSAPERFYSATEAKFRLADAYAGDGNAEKARSILRPLALDEASAVRRRAFAALDKLNLQPSAPRAN